MRCHACDDLQYENSKPGVRSGSIIFNTNYHETVRGVRQSVDQGCEFCTLVLAGMRPPGSQDYNDVLDDTNIKLELYMSERWSKERGAYVNQDGAVFWLRVGRTQSNPRAPAQGLQASFKVNVGPQSDKTLPSPALDPHTGSPRTISLIKTWFSHCQAHHPSCPPSNPVHLPTRLIAVSTATSPTVHLHTAPPSTTGKYLALSHCWGTHPLLTTTTANLPSHTHSISLSSLPATFRDAILTTRALGYQYLWIDSLCILQDSVHDWATESSQMGRYYADAAIVLAAAHAKDSTQGMFRARNPWGHQPCYLAGLKLPGTGVVQQVSDKGWSYYGWPAEEVEGGAMVTRETGWEGERERTGPLDGRAWTMQEQMLAGRMVRWEGWQVRWVCKGGEGSENMPGLGVRKGPAEVGWTKLLGREEEKGEGGMEKGELYMDWYRTVERYTTRAITKQFDILPAIGGLASRFRPLVDDRYVVGLWEGDLHRGLLWTVEGSIQPGEQRFRAPSWSWAAINLTGISFKQIPSATSGTWERDWFEVEEILVPLASANPYGQVVGGTLKATGFVRELRLAGPSVAGKVYEYRKNKLLNSETEEAVGDIFLDHPRMSTDPVLAVWCMPVLHSGTDNGSATAICLALVSKGNGSGEQRFKRVGLAKVTSKPWERGFFGEGGKGCVLLV